MKYAIAAFVLLCIAVNYFPVESVPQAPANIVALVKYKDTVYQCEAVKPTICGYTIHCGNMSVHCVDKNTLVEWL